MLESGDGEPMFLQLKEAGPSVLEQFDVDRVPGHHGRRVVEGQQLVQSAVDVFLGWSHFEGESDTTDFYVRQLWDGKASAIVEEMAPKVLTGYARLVRGGARPGPRPLRRRRRDQRLPRRRRHVRSCDHAPTPSTTPDATNSDHAAVLAAIASGELPVIRDI